MLGQCVAGQRLPGATGSPPSGGCGRGVCVRGWVPARAGDV